MKKLFLISCNYWTVVVTVTKTALAGGCFAHRKLCQRVRGSRPIGALFYNLKIYNRYMPYMLVRSEWDHEPDVSTPLRLKKKFIIMLLQYCYFHYNHYHYIAIELSVHQTMNSEFYVMDRGLGWLGSFRDG